MRLEIKTKSTGRVIAVFDGDYDYQVFLSFENFVKSRIMQKDFSDKIEYILVIYRK